MRIVLPFFVVGLIALTSAGCGANAADQHAAQATAVSFDGAKYILADEPDGAVGIIAARESAKDGEPIVMVGRVGGADKPWIEGRAAFMMLDASKSVVSVGKESNGNEICMGDCCASERAACTALVTVVDEGGQVLPVDSRQLLRIAENDMILVRGKVKKDDTGNFSVVADGVYVRR